ncbi:MAG: cupredoxin domain-containing protein [Patescibacteria group bacterium]|nr:cupredoxin domain-containing protein [Patescibacteria group bacterium]
MPKRTFVLGIVFVAALAVLVWVIFQTPQPDGTIIQNRAPAAGGTSTALTTAAGANQARVIASSGAKTVSGAQIPAGPVRTGPLGQNAVTAPAAGADWALGANHVVSWERATRVTGGIALMNAADGSMVGWLIGQTNGGDTSFTWNTRDLYVSRTSATKITVQPGKYFLKVIFDSAQWPAIVSPSFSIIQPDQVRALVYNLAVKDGVFSSSAITVQHGTKLLFANQDQTAYVITISGFGVPFTLEPGGSYTFDTAPLAPGSIYVFYSASSSALRVTVTIQ